MREVKRDDVFAGIAPPPGGLTRLRARLDEEGAADPLRWHRAAWAGAALAAVALLWTLPTIAPARLENAPGLVRLGVAAAPRSAVVVPGSARADLAVLAVAETPDVVFYRVSSTRAPGT